MKKIVGYLNNYLFEVDKKILLLSTVFIGSCIFLNYHFRIEKAILRLPFPEKYTAWFLLFLLAFSFPYMLYFLFKKKKISDPKFYFLLFIASALFAWKLSSGIHFSFSKKDTEDNYWNHVAYWPFKLIVVSGCLWVIWKLFDRDQPFYGVN